MLILQYRVTIGDKTIGDKCLRGNLDKKRALKKYVTLVDKGVKSDRKTHQRSHIA